MSLSETLCKVDNVGVMSFELDPYCMTEVGLTELVDEGVISSGEAHKIVSFVLQESMKAQYPSDFKGGECDYYIHNLGMDSFFIVGVWNAWGTITDRIWDSSGVFVTCRDTSDGGLTFYRGEMSSGLRKSHS